MKRVLCWLLGHKWGIVFARGKTFISDGVVYEVKPTEKGYVHCRRCGELP